MTLRCPLALLFLAACSSDPQASGPASTLHVGEELMIPLVEGPNRIVLPLTSDSELVPVAQLDSLRRVPLRFDGTARVAIIEHADDERVVCARGGHPLLLGPPQLPETDATALPLVAHLDGDISTGKHPVSMPGDGLSLVCLRADTGQDDLSPQLPRSPIVATVISPIEAEPGMEVVFPPADQIVAALVEMLYPKWTEHEGEALVVLPELMPGRTATVLVDVRGGPAALPE